MQSDTAGMCSAKGTVETIQDKQPLLFNRKLQGEERTGQGTHRLKGTKETYVNCLHCNCSYIAKPYFDLSQDTDCYTYTPR